MPEKLKEVIKKFNRSSKRTLLRRLLRGAVNPVLVKLTNDPDYLLENSLVVVGAPRSGTTWLSELLLTIPRSALLFEPLNFPKVPEARLAGFDWHEFRHPKDEWLKGQALFDKILRGEVLNSWTTSFMPISNAIRPDIWVIKFVRANMLLGWFVNRFSIRPPVFIIRHPCATILSQKQQGWPPPIKPPHFQKFLFKFPQFVSVLKNLKHEEEYMAAIWCVENYAALALAPPESCIVMSYEGLVREGIAELKRLFNIWNLSLPGEAIEKLNKRSQMTKKDSPGLGTGDPLNQWKEKLSRVKSERIIAVVKEFGLDFYGLESEPNYSRLYGKYPLS